MPIPDRHALCDLASLYLFLAAKTDNSLEAVEVEALVERLHAYAPELEVSTIHDVVSEAEAEAETRPVRLIVEDLKYAALPDAVREAVLEDLAGIARADGLLHVNEVAFVRALARAWDLQPPPGFEPETRPAPEEEE